MKKILVAPMVIILLCMMLSIPVLADSLEITYPPQGARVTDDLKSISFSSAPGLSAVVYLNGEEIKELTTEDENTVELSEKLPIGENTLKVYTYGDGAVQSAEICFEVRKIVYEQNFIEVFDGALGKFEIAEGMEYGEFGSDADGNKTYISLTYDFDGPDGSKAAGFYANGNIVTPKGSVRFFNTGVSGLFKNGIWVIEYDLKLFSKAHFFLESKNGAAGTFPFIGGKEFLKYDGTIASTGKAYPLGEWMHITHTLDTMKGEQTHVISWGENVVSYTTADSSVVSLTYLRPTTEFKQTTGNGEHGVLMDNFKVGTEQHFSGYNLLYYQDEAGVDIECTENVIKSDKVSVIKLRCENPVIGDVDITKEVKILANDEPLAINSAIVDESGEFLTIKFCKPIPAQADIVMCYQYESSQGDISLGFTKSFKTEFLEFGISETTFKRGEEIIGFSRQLCAGDTVDISASFKNTVEDKNVVFVTAAYKGDEIIYLSAQNVESKRNRRKTATDTVTLPSQGEDFKIECYLFDAFLTRIPISKIWTLK